MAKNSKKKNCLTKPFFNFSSFPLLCITAVVLGMIFSFVLHAVYADWVEPEDDPPFGNVYPPINVSDIAQTKQGGLCIGIDSATACKADQEIGLGTEDPLSRLTIKGTGNSEDTSSFYIYNSDSNPILYVDNDRQVGIRTSDRNEINYPLTVKGDVAVIGNESFILDGSNGKSEFYMDTNKYNVFKTDLISGSKGFIFAPQGTERVRVEFDGKVGINNVTPSARLDIKGAGEDYSVKAINGNIAAIYADSTGQYGVYGQSGTVAGVGGYSSAAYGVSGVSGSSYGVYGYSNSSVGVYGMSASGTGVYGKGTTGVYAEGTSYGIYAKNTSDYAAKIEGTSYMTSTVNIGKSDTRLTSSALNAYTNVDLTAINIDSEGLKNKAALVAKGTKSSGYYTQAELGKVDGNNISAVYGTTSASGGEGPIGVLGYRQTSNGIYYGVYGKAGTASGTNYAGYFENGLVKVTSGNLEIENGQLSVNQSSGNGIVSKFTSGPINVSYAVVGDASNILGSTNAIGIKACGPDDAISSDPLCGYLGSYYYSGYFEGQIALQQMPNSLIPGEPIYSAIHFDPKEDNQAVLEYHTEQNAIIMTIYKEGFSPAIHKFCGPGNGCSGITNKCVDYSTVSCTEDDDCNCTPICESAGGECKAYCPEGWYPDSSLYCFSGVCCIRKPYQPEE